MDVSWCDFQAKGDRHSKNTKGRVEMEDRLQDTLAYFDELTSKGASMMCASSKTRRAKSFLFANHFKRGAHDDPFFNDCGEVKRMMD
jgi:hypothetical protein